ncbi:MAG TPA: ATP-binding protein, partial [Pyrinomonadaceae bacterium]
NNIVRHSGCTTVKSSLRIERGTIILRLSDNGRGFDEGNIEPGHGLESMRRRAKKLGGKIEINSPDGAGTTLILTAPNGGRV